MEGIQVYGAGRIYILVGCVIVSSLRQSSPWGVTEYLGALEDPGKCKCKFVNCETTGIGCKLYHIGYIAYFHVPKLMIVRSHDLPT